MFKNFNKLEKSWIYYDIGNSAFTMMVSTIIPIWFNTLAANAGMSNSEYLAFWSYATSIATILVASAVSVSGNIGWIGLVIPQLVRLLVGSNSRYTAPLSFLMGSSFLLTVDMINRIISTAELPVSIISGLLGLPIFVICWFINAKKQKGGLL